MKKKILIFASYFLPGFMAGGPIRSLTNLIQHFGDEYDFYVITRDRDLGSQTPYPESAAEDWLNIGGARVRYLSNLSSNARTIAKLVQNVSPDLLYFNSFFDPVFTIKPLILRRLGLIRSDISVIVAPRGELAQGALAIKANKKKLFLPLAKLLTLYRKAIWQASSRFEATDIEKVFSPPPPVIIAANLPAKINELESVDKKKNPGTLQVVCVARVARNKNIAGALQILQSVTVNIDFHLYGPNEDSTYLEECLQLVKKLPANITAHFHGHLPAEDIAPVIKAYDLFFLPTEGENFGHAILEALQAGLPVLISNRTPWRDLQSLGIGWDLPLEKPELFKEVLELCARMNDKDYSTLAQNSRTYGYSISTNKDTVEATRTLFELALSR